MLATQAPFVQYFDKDGTPLDGGYVYFGLVNQNPETAPTVVYWDAAGTQPAAQPIRTVNGYTVRSGSPAVIYASGNYSLTTRNSKGELVINVPNSAASGNDQLLQDQLDAFASKTDAAKGSGLIGFNPTLNYARGTLGWSESSLRAWNVTDHPWLAKFDGVTDDTAAIQACLTAVYNAGGGTVVLPAGTAIVTTISQTFIASRTVNIRGAGQKATVLQQAAGASGPVLDMTGGPSVLDLFATYSDFTISGNANSQHGLRATRFATSTTVNLGIINCNVGFEAVGCLVMTHINPYFQFNKIGYRSRKSGAVYSNLVIFQGGKIGGGDTFGLDIGDASGVQVYGTDLSGSGTAGSPGTGGVILRDTCDDEIGYGVFLMVGGWLEGNKGRQFQTEACPGLSVTMIGVNIASSESGQAINISAGIKGAEIINCVAASPGDKIECGTTPTTVIGGTFSNILGSATTLINAADSTGARPFETPSAIISDRIRMGASAIITDNLATPVQGDLTAKINDSLNAGNGASFYKTSGVNGNAAATALKLGANSSTSRSINAGGTVNTSGADYAEYETKRPDCGTIAKGDLVGFDAAGLLTDRFDLAVSFGIKSTAPSFVGGDVWFSEQPPELAGETDEELAQYAEDMAAFNARLEASRQKVDRIAYSGKVPVNLMGAAPGDWIIAARGADGKIVPMTSTTGDNAVGRVRNILEDGRALVTVKSV